MFHKRIPKREFRLRSHAEEFPAPKEEENKEGGRHVRFPAPDRTGYPRVLDFWPVFVIVGILFVMAIFVLRWISG